MGDTSEFLIGEHGNKLYLAAILDLYSRFVVGWASRDTSSFTPEGLLGRSFVAKYTRLFNF